MTPRRSTPTLAQCRKLAEEKGYESAEVRHYRLSQISVADALHIIHRTMITSEAPTRAAALAGLYAILQALPKRRGK